MSQKAYAHRQILQATEFRKRGKFLDENSFPWNAFGPAAIFDASDSRESAEQMENAFCSCRTCIYGMTRDDRVGWLN